MIATSNDIIVLRNNLPSSSESTSFGTICLSAGRYTASLTLPNNSSASEARILIKSVSNVSLTFSEHNRACASILKSEGDKIMLY